MAQGSGFVLYDRWSSDYYGMQVLYCTVHCCTVLYCTVLYCTVRYYFPLWTVQGCTWEEKKRMLNPQRVEGRTNTERKRGYRDLEDEGAALAQSALNSSVWLDFFFVCPGSLSQWLSST